MIFPRQGLLTGKPVIMRNARTTDIAARVAKAQQNLGGDAVIFVDDTGHWGHGVIDNLITAGIGALPVFYHSKALNPRYKNRRAEMWLEGAEWIRNGGCLPNMPELVAELTTPTYTFVGGQFQLEDKDLVKQRLGRSPDLADALFLTFAMPDMPKDVSGHRGSVGKVRIDWDPYADAQQSGGRG